MFRKKPKIEPEARHDYELEEAIQTAAAGRRLAIYDRATNLYAYWYLELRGDEEITRARRYGKPLTLLSLWARNEKAITRLAEYLPQHLRDNDLAGYLNNGHFVVLLLETGMRGAQIVLDRTLAAFAGDLEGAAVCYPDDAESFPELLEAAKSGMSDEKEARRA